MHDEVHPRSGVGLGGQCLGFWCVLVAIARNAMAGITSAVGHLFDVWLVICLHLHAAPAMVSQPASAPATLVVFLGSGLTNFGFNWAVTQGDVVRVVLLFYTMPAWSVLFAWWLLDEKPHRMAMLRLLLALCGVALVLKTPEIPWPWPSGAMDYLALLGGASFALNNAMLRKLAYLPESDRMAAMFGGGMCITAAAAAALAPLGLVYLPTDVSWWPFALGLSLCLLFSNLSLQYGAARLPAHTTALVMLSEIVFATASSVFMGVSELSLRKLMGGLMIVFAAILATMQAHTKESE